MTEDGDSSEEEYDSPTDDPVVPNREELIQAYIQYSEESRYRDGLMHNSYYFILIAAVIFTGNLLSLNFKGNPINSPKLWFAIAVIGLVVAGIGIVMTTYHQKRRNAEDQRQVLEDVLDASFEETGLQKEHSSEKFGPRQKDNPFASQDTVTSRNEAWEEKFFRDTLPVSKISRGMFWGGLLVVGLAGAKFVCVVWP